MAKNYSHPGNVVTAIAPTGGAVSGIVYVVGAMFGVAATSAAETEEYELVLGGVWELPKTSAQAWTPGAVIYWDDGAEVATTTATDNTKIGVATLAAANPSGTGFVRLNNSF